MPINDPIFSNTMEILLDFSVCRGELNRPFMHWICKRTQCLPKLGHFVEAFGLTRSQFNRVSQIRRRMRKNIRKWWDSDITIDRELKLKMCLLILWNAYKQIDYRDNLSVLDICQHIVRGLGHPPRPRSEFVDVNNLLEFVMSFRDGEVVLYGELPYYE